MRLLEWFLKNILPILKKHLTTIIACCIVVISLSYAFSLSSQSCLLKNKWCGEDVDQYKDYSDNLFTGHGYTSHQVNNMYFIPRKENIYIPETIRHPAFPLLLTLGRLIYNKPPLLLFFNYMFFIGILFFTYKTAQILLKNDWLSLLVLFIVSFHAEMIYYTALLGNVDTFSAFTLVGFIYFSSKVFFNKVSHSFGNIIGASIFGIGAAMARENTPFFLLFFLVLLLCALHFFLKEKKIQKNVFIIFFVVLLSVLVWSVRLYTLTGQILVAVDAGTQLFDEHIVFTLHPTRQTKQMVYWYNVTAWKEMVALRNQGKTIPQANALIDGQIQKMTYNYLWQHKDITFTHVTISFYRLFTQLPFSWGDSIQFLRIKRYTFRFNLISFFVMLVFPLVILLRLKKRDRSFYFICCLWLSAFVFLLLSAFYHGAIMVNRGEIAVLPLVAILVICFAQMCYDWMRISFLPYISTCFMRK